MAIPYSGGQIVKTLLPRTNWGFLKQVCANLIECGWTETTSIQPWCGFQTNTSPSGGGNNYFQPTQNSPTYVWKDTPATIYEVQTGSPFNAWNRMGQRLLDHQICSSYRCAVQSYDWLFGYYTNIRMRANVPDILVMSSDENPDSRYSWAMRFAFDSSYFWYAGGNWWHWGYRVFDSVPTEQGLKIRIGVGWQIGASGVLYPCIKMMTYDGILDPFHSYDDTRSDFWNETPIWNPCVGSVTSVDYEMICGPCWFMIYAKEITTARRWIYGGVIKLLDTMKPIRCTITPGSTTTVNYYTPHKQHVGSYIAFTGVDPLDGGPVITSQLYRVVEIVNETQLRIALSTSGFTYSPGFAGDDKHPINAAFIVAPDVSDNAAPRKLLASGSGTRAEAYFWNTTYWASGGTGTSSTSNANTNSSLRFPAKSTRVWPGGRSQIYEPYVGWSESAASNNNMIRGMLFDAVAMNKAFPIDSMITNKSLDNHNWQNIADPGAGGSIHLLIP